MTNSCLQGGGDHAFSGPHPQEFVDSFVFIGALNAGRGTKLAGDIAKAIPEGVKKLRNIYEATGKTPLEVAEAAKGDPTVRQDLLSINEDIPGAFAEETLNRLKAGEEVPTEELQGYLPRPWAKAELLERQGPEAVQGGIRNTVENALQGKPAERLHWKVLRQEEAVKLSQDTGTDVTPGLVHSIDPMEVRHSYKRHGSPETELPRGQEPIQANDYLLIPEITANYDTVRLSTTDNGLPALQYTKKIGNEFFVVEEIRAGKNELAFSTMWKMKEKEAGTATLPTPEATAVGPAAVADQSLKAAEPTSPLRPTSETPRGMSTPTHAEKQADGLTKDTTPSAEVNPSQSMFAGKEFTQRRGTSIMEKASEELRGTYSDGEEFSATYTIQDNRGGRNITGPGIKAPGFTLRRTITDDTGKRTHVASEDGWLDMQKLKPNEEPLTFYTEEHAAEWAADDASGMGLRSPSEVKPSSFSDAYAEHRDTGYGVPTDPNKPVLPEQPLSHKDATSISGVISALEKAFDVPIRIGKFRDKALGIYYGLHFCRHCATFVCAACMLRLPHYKDAGRCIYAKIGDNP